MDASVKRNGVKNLKRAWTFLAVLIALVWNECAYAIGPYCVDVPEGRGMIDETGAFLVEPGIYDEIIVIEPGMLYLAGEKGNYNILDGEGQAISNIRVAMARYVDDVIIFRWNGLYGAMDLSGKVLIGPVWHQLTTDGMGGYLALNDYAYDNVADEIIHIDASGEIVYTGNYTVGILEDVSSDRIPYMTTDGSYGFADGRGKIITQPVWLYAGEFDEGMGLVSDENGIGLVDADAHMILECRYRFIDRGDGMIIALNKDDVLEVYAADGKTQLFNLEAGEKSVSRVGNCIVLADNESVMLYNCEGMPVYSGSAFATFATGLNGQIIVSDGKWGEACVWLMDQSGNALSGMYQRILPLAGNRYAFLTMSGATYFSDALGDFERSWNYESIRYGMMDDAGKPILPDEYLEIVALDEDRFVLKAEEGVYLSDKDGEIIQYWPLPVEG